MEPHCPFLLCGHDAGVVLVYLLTRRLGMLSEGICNCVAFGDIFVLLETPPEISANKGSIWILKHHAIALQL